MYVGDNLRVGVRTEPSNAIAPIEVIETGDRVEVLAERGGHYRIRTASGREGWVRKRYLITDKPARLLLNDIEARNHSLNGRLASLQDRTEELGVENKQLERENSSLRKEVAVLRTDDRTWLYWFSGILAVGPLGFLLGLLWYRYQIMKKLGGLTL